MGPKIIIQYLNVSHLGIFRTRYLYILWRAHFWKKKIRGVPHRERDGRCFVRGGRRGQNAPFGGDDDDDDDDVWASVAESSAIAATAASSAAASRAAPAAPAVAAEAAGAPPVSAQMPKGPDKGEAAASPARGSADAEGASPGPPARYTRASNESEGRSPGFGLQRAAEVAADFERIFGKGELTDHLSVCNKGVAGLIKTTKCRCIAWKMFLGLLPAGGTLGTWVEHIAKRNGMLRFCVRTKRIKLHGRR